MGRDKAFSLRFATALIFLWAHLLLPAQTPTVYSLRNDIPVKVDSHTLTAAWAGGLNSPQFNAIDLNNDGTDDLVIFDRQTNALLTFINGGTPNAIDYAFAPEYISLFPDDLSEWLILADFDGDGAPDIFTNLPSTSNIRVFRNTAPENAGQLGFSIYKDTIYSDYQPYLPLYSARSDFPAIIDVDEDGDLDILTFHLGAREMEWHRNMSIENYNDLTHLEFYVQSGCFGHFKEDPFTCAVNLEQPPCSPGARIADPNLDNGRTGIHAGATILALDLNGDSLKEIILADVDCANVQALRNAGTLEVAHFDAAEETYPSNDVPVNIPVFPATFYLDVNNDGFKDLVAAPNKTGDVEDVRGVSWHKNVGQNNQPDFRFQNYGLLSEEMIETGTASAPVFFDYNADGLQDLLIGNLGRFDSVDNYQSHLELYENTGTAQQPEFTRVSADYLGFSSHPDVVPGDYFVPAAADLDGDGDPDLLIGGLEGQLYYFRNDANLGGPANFTYVTPQYAGIDAGLLSAPELFDLDQDGDIDLLVGHHRGYIQYYENTGNSQVANFVKVTDSLGRVKVNDFTGAEFTNGYAKPRLVDVDRDGQVELLVGALEGEVQVYDQVSALPGAVFTRKPDLAALDFGKYAAVAAAELDSSRLTFVVGNERGGLMLLRDTGILETPMEVVAAPEKLLVYPNPAREFVEIQLENVARGEKFSLQLWDMTGKMLWVKNEIGEKTRVDLVNISVGMYFLVAESEKYRIHTKLIVKSK